MLDEVNQFLEKFTELDLDCPVVAVAPYEMEGDIETAARDFRDLCTIAQRYGARLMFESVCWSKQFGHLAPSWELVRRADCTNGGLLIDTFHLVKSGDPIDDLREIPPEKVFLVHVSDAKPLSMGFMEQSRRFRFLPGSGEAPLRQMLANLREAGYDGFYCLEIFNEEYWRGDLRQLAIASRKALADLGV